MDRAPGTFTRDELDTAEREVPPSLRGQWLIGFVLGAVGGLVAGWAGPVSLVAFVALPWAFTPAGAGLLVGSGSLSFAYLLVVSDQLGGMRIDALAIVLAAVAVALFAIGVVGSVVASRRGRTG